jgi:Spy/CpxP family protein refolding chaperone
VRLPAVSGLTSMQRQSLEELHNKTHLQLTPLRAGLWLRNQELDAIWASESPSREKIAAKLSELDLIRGRMREILVEQRLAVLALLTPEQRVSFRAQMVSARPPARTAPKSSVLGLEECMSTGDCAGGPPPGLKQR